MRVVYLFKKDKYRGRVKTPSGAIPAEKIVEALKKVFPFFSRICGQVHVADEYYYPVDSTVINDAKHLTLSFNIPAPKAEDYKEVVWDCDDYSFYWKGLIHMLGYFKGRNFAFGIVWVYSPVKLYGHALNFYIDNTCKLYFFEPQTLETFPERRDEWRLIEVKI